MSGLALTLKNLFLPQFCQQCRMRLLTEENGYFCPTCWERSPRVIRPFCTVCGKPHPGMVGYGSPHNFPCADCREHAKPNRSLRRVYGAAVYAEAVEGAVKLLKFHGKVRLAKPLGELMAVFAREEMETDEYDLIMPVPLHRVRERHRGFNQSRLLAERILGEFPNATLDESLKRIRPTQVQSRISDPADRKKNVVGAFAVEQGIHLKGRRILLIDDVVTTAGTVRECAKALRKADAAFVDVLAAALAVKKPILT